MIKILVAIAIFVFGLFLFGDRILPGKAHYLTITKHKVVTKSKQVRSNGSSLSQLRTTEHHQLLFSGGRALLSGQC